MANVLSNEKREQVIGLGRLGWSLRRIEETTGVRRETASAYLKAAGVTIRPPRRWGRGAKPANEVSTDSPAVDETPAAATDTGSPATEPSAASTAASVPPGRSPTTSACEPYREVIVAARACGRNAMAIWQDLVDGHGFPAGYASVMRFVRQLRGVAVPEAHAIIQTAPGEEAQVDYGEGPMVRDPDTHKYRRTRLFVFTLGYSRKSVRLLTFRSSTRIWATLHERAFRRLGGCPAVVILDNLKEGVRHADVYDPTLNPLYRDVLAHYGVTALPCRVADPDRKSQASHCGPFCTCGGSLGY
jgi:transposase